MALKDITLGQYFPGHSLIHRFDPRGKIIFTVIYIVAIFLCNSALLRHSPGRAADPHRHF